MRYLIVSLCLAAFLLTQGCTKQPMSADASTAKGTAKIQLVASVGSAFAALARSAAITVTGAGIDTIRRPLSVNENSISGTVENIPAGAARHFQVFVYDSAGQVCYYGASAADVIANNTVPVHITLYRWSMGNAVIDGRILDSIHTPDTLIDTMISLDTISNQCRVIDTFRTYNSAFGRNVCFARRICHGDTLVDTIRIDTVNNQCRAVDTSYYNDGFGRRICYIKKVCNGDTISTVDTIRIDTINRDTIADTVFHHGAGSFSIILSDSVLDPEGDTIMMRAIFSDSTTTYHVSFYCDSILLGSSLSIPYAITAVVPALSVGRHVIRAVARDINGNSRNSNSVPVTVLGAINYSLQKRSPLLRYR